MTFTSECLLTGIIMFGNWDSWNKDVSHGILIIWCFVKVIRHLSYKNAMKQEPKFFPKEIREIIIMNIQGLRLSAIYSLTIL
jgi:hypothetical protein